MRGELVVVGELVCAWAGSGWGFSEDDATRIDAWASTIAETAALYGIAADTDVLLAIAWVESRFDPTAHSSAGARGIMQLMPVTWATMRDELGMPKNADPFSAQLNIRAGVFLFSKLRARWPTLDEAVAAYFAGSGNVRRWGAARYSDYVLAVMRAAVRFAGARKWCAGGEIGPSPPGESADEARPPKRPPGHDRPPPSSAAPKRADAGGSAVLAALLGLAGLLVLG